MSRERLDLPEIPEGRVCQLCDQPPDPEARGDTMQRVVMGTETSWVCGACISEMGRPTPAAVKEVEGRAKPPQRRRA